MRFMNKYLMSALVMGSVLFGAGAAQADVVDCAPLRARSYSDRLDTRCQNIDRWFIALRSDTNPEHFKEMLSLLNSAILTGKSVKLYYTLDASGNGILKGVELFR